MSNEIEATVWVNRMYAKRTEPPKQTHYKVKNGNVTGVFEETTALLAGGKSYVIPKGSSFCVFGAIGGAGTAALISDVENGDVTVYKSGKVARSKPDPARTGAKSHPRMNVPFGIG